MTKVLETAARERALIEAICREAGGGNMAYDRNTSSQQFAETINAMAFAGRNALNWGALWRAIAEHRREEYERRIDREFVFDAKPDFDRVIDRAEKVAQESPTALQVDLQGVLLNTVLDWGLAWQDFLERELPVLRECLEDFQAEEDPSPVIRRALIDQVRTFFQKFGEFVRDQSTRTVDDIADLQEKIIPDRYP